MPIILLSRNFPPAICGVGDYTHRLAEALAALGHTITIITGTTEATSTTAQVLHVRRWPHDIPQQLQKAVKQYGPATLLWQYTPASFSRQQMPFWWPAMMRRLHKQGFQQAIIFHEVAMRNQGSLRQRLRAIAQQWIANRANQLAAGAATSVALYQQYFRQRPPLIIPVGANLLPKTTLLSRSEASGSIEFFCFTNRCSPALLQALARWSTPALRWTLHLAGRCHPAQWQAIETQLARLSLGGHVVVHGEQPASELASLMQSAQVMLQAQPVSATGEGGVSAKNGVTASAFAFGLPVITTRGDMTDTQLFVHGHNCWLIPQDEPAQWATAIATLAADPALRQKLGHAARQTFAQQLSWPHIARQVATQILQVDQPHSGHQDS